VTKCNLARRDIILTAATAGIAAMSAPAIGQNRTDTEPRELHGKQMPEPTAEKSAGPVKAGRGTVLTDKVAVVTGAARGIGRAIAVEFALNGAEVIALDIAGPVSPASNAEPAGHAMAQNTLSPADPIRPGEFWSPPCAWSSERAPP
jgi:hypothetical protein